MDIVLGDLVIHNASSRLPKASARSWVDMVDVDDRELGRGGRRR